MTRALLALAAAGLVAAVPASAATPTRFERVAGAHSAGTPAKYNRVGILEIGPKTAKNVLVLNPGTSAGAGYFGPLARSIVASAKGWQVWSVERRENLLEDQSMLDRAKAGKATAQQVGNYYLNWLQDSSVNPHFQLIPDDKVAFARKWGMNVEIQDLRRVVQRAQKLGGKVVLGGHSLGGSITTAYATWDFHGTAGAKGLSGLVFIDGASSPTPITSADATQRLNDLAKGSPWLSVGGIPAPFAGLFISLGATLAKVAPNEASQAQQLKLLPDEFKPPVPATNAGQFGFALDTTTSPAAVALAQAHLGHLADSGDPRGWVDDGELTPLQRFADAFSGWGVKGVDGSAWYHPQRLSIDSGAIGDGIKNPAQKVLGVHATHGKDLPRSLRLYAFAAALGGQRVIDATKALAKQSHIPARQVTIVDRHATYAHNDPNTAAPGRNEFLKKLIPLLRKIG